MSVTDDLVANNAVYAETCVAGQLAPSPSHHLAVVTCMDARIDVFAVLGLKNGEAHVLRNAGGVVTDDVIRSLSISQRKLGTREIVLIQHTYCGMQTITDDGFRAELQQETGIAPGFAIESFSDIDANVRQSLARIEHSPFLQHRTARGFVFDVESGLLREVLRS